MSTPVPLQNRFDRMIRDVSRDRLPQGACWNLVDYVPNILGAPLVKRGGTAYGSTAPANHTRIDAVFDAPFANGNQVCMVSHNPPSTWVLYAGVSPGGTGTNRGSIQQPFTPVFYRQLLILPTGGSPYKYNGNSLTTLGGSPPNAPYATVYKDHLLLARSSNGGVDVRFSAAGDAESWPSESFINTSQEITGIYALNNAVIVFHRDSLERIIGNIPPPGSDMYLQTVWDRGTTHPWSLAGTEDFVCFANAEGVFLTDGSEPIDLTREGGISSYWQAQMASVSKVAGGYWRGYYITSLLNGNTLIDNLVCEIATKRWFRFSNIPASSFARASDASTLYAGNTTEARLLNLGNVLNPSSSSKNDANGTAVTPIVETPFYLLGQSPGRVKHVYGWYDLRDASADNPSLTVSAVYSPEQTSYTALSPSWAETTAISRGRASINKAAPGFGLKIAQTNASASTRLYSLQADAHPREGSRLS